MHALLQASDEVTAALRKTMEKLQGEFEKRYPGEAIYSDQADKEWSKAYKEMHESKEFKQLDARSTELDRSLGKYLVKPTVPSLTNEFATCHGYVWLFLRK